MIKKERRRGSLKYRSEIWINMFQKRFMNITLLFNSFNKWTQLVLSSEYIYLMKNVEVEFKGNMISFEMNRYFLK